MFEILDKIEALLTVFYDNLWTLDTLFVLSHKINIIWQALKFIFDGKNGILLKIVMICGIFIKLQAICRIQLELIEGQNTTELFNVSIKNGGFGVLLKETLT